MKAVALVLGASAVTANSLMVWEEGVNLNYAAGFAVGAALLYWGLS